MIAEHSKYDELNIALAHVADLIKHKQYKRAERILNDLIPLADSIVNLDERFSAFFQLARAFIMLDNKEKADELLSSMEEELKSMIASASDDIKARFYVLVIEIERVKYGLIAKEEAINKLETIKAGFEELLRLSKDKSIVRYYIAFLVILWAPFVSRFDPKRAREELLRVLNTLEYMSTDPQYAELLTTLAEIAVSIGNKEEAAEFIRRALGIYRSDPNYFKEEIESIRSFTKKFLRDKYHELFMNDDEKNF